MIRMNRRSVTLNDRAASLFEQYELTIERTRKGRGAIIAETDRGMKILMEYQGYREKAEILERVMNHIKENGFPFIDCLLRNKEGELLTADYDGKLYIVKDFLAGQECNVKDLKECTQAIKGLAHLHSCMKGFPEDLISPVTRTHIAGEFDKKNAQLKRVRTFIRKASAKTDFELLFLKEYERFLSQTIVSSAYLTDEICDALCSKLMQDAAYCHGDCSHHNLLTFEDHVNIINFEKCRPDTQMKDLALFMRKILEKNDWNRRLGMELLDAYSKELTLSKAELSYLYARLAYPEKFVKIAGSYLNQRKSLPAKRQQDKLYALLAREEERTRFLDEYRKEFLKA